MDTQNFHYLLPLVLSIIRYFLLSGLPFLIFYVVCKDSFVKNKIQDRIATKEDYFREVTYSMLTTFILAGMTILLIKTPLIRYTQIYQNHSDYPLWWIPLSIIIAFIIHDTYFYWMHRLAHHRKLFQIVHSVHHKSVNPTPWASYAFQFLEAVLQGLIIPIVLILLPLHIFTLASFAFLVFATNVYGHLGYEIVPKWFRHSFLFQIFNTSIYHNLHHTRSHQNFGLYFRFWDRVMKTENQNYVAEFDRIQEKRFGKDQTIAQ